MAVIVAWPFMGFVPNLPTDFPRQCPSEMVRIVTFNADNKDADRARFKAFLEESNPDCVALEDANRFSEADFPAGWRVVDGGNGLKLAARHRVTLEDSLSDARIGTARGVAKFRVQFPTGDRTIAVIHLMTPRHGLEAVLAKKLAGLPELDAAIKQRDAGSRTARAWLGDTGELLICGDFNLPVESVIYQRDWATFNNAFSSCGSGFGHTMASRRGSVRIDHCLSRGSWTPTAITLGPDLGSAHLPVLADYRP
jgi:endonuclease/exonuclease/phosphatase (EEP) superfamily protein YafD